MTELSGQQARHSKAQELADAAAKLVTTLMQMYDVDGALIYLNNIQAKLERDDARG